MMMSAPKDEEWLTPEQAAVLKGVTPQAITKAIRQGRLPARDWGRFYLLRRKAVEAWTPGAQRGSRRKE